MRSNQKSDLERLGLSGAEAEIYLALSRGGGPLGATALADATGTPRTAVYPILTSLTQKGMVESGAGYGSRFTAVRPDKALPSLIAREREELLQRERLAEEELLQRKRLADELVKQLESVAKATDTNGEANIIQVLRDPRVMAERYSRLQQEVERQVDGFAKAPIMTVPLGNPAQAKAQKRGVRYRALYEKAVLEEPGVKPYLKAWIDGGEEARVFDGELPHKLAIFDQQIVLLPLIMPHNQTRTLVIQHPQLAQSLTLLFEFLWAQAMPLVLEPEGKTSTPVGPKQTKKTVSGKKNVLAKPNINKTNRNGARPLPKR
jgi:sugar-specific transcriptional regulator TrmB